MQEVAPVVQKGWVVVKQWHALATEDDPDGWYYANDFVSRDW